MLPQSARKKSFCYCSSNYNYDCYKEVLGPIYPSQTITIYVISFHMILGLGQFVTKEVVADTTLPTACVITNPTEIKQLVKRNNCTELKYSIAFQSENWWSYI